MDPSSPSSSSPTPSPQPQLTTMWFCCRVPKWDLCGTGPRGGFGFPNSPVRNGAWLSQEKAYSSFWGLFLVLFPLEIPISTVDFRQHSTLADVHQPHGLQAP